MQQLKWKQVIMILKQDCIRAKTAREVLYEFSHATSTLHPPNMPDNGDFTVLHETSKRDY
jgi:hypothetical protein